MVYKLNILAIGGSRNIGYYSAVRFLGMYLLQPRHYLCVTDFLQASGSTVTFLLRSPSVFDQDEAIQGYVGSGQAHLLKGDALVRDDVQCAWDHAAKAGDVDLLLFTVGESHFQIDDRTALSYARLLQAELPSSICAKVL